MTKPNVKVQSNTVINNIVSVLIFYSYLLYTDAESAKMNEN